MISRLVVMMALLGAITQLQAQKVSVAKAGFIEDTVTTTPACHSSSIVALDNNRLMATWFGGEYEGHKDVSIYTAIYSNGAWQKAVKVADGVVDQNKRFPAWNPVLFKTKVGVLFLYYKVGPNPREWWGMMKVSTNNGQTWSEAKRLPGNNLGPIKNKPIQLANGKVLHPSSTESKDEKVWHAHLEVSDGASMVWQDVQINCDTFGVIQPAILTYPGNKLQMLFRSRQNRIIESWSTDEGKTWSALKPLNILNPNSGIDAVSMKNGWQVLVYNPAVAGADWFNGRNELRVAVSKDGKNWKDVYTLEKHDKGEFSYPAIITVGNQVHITYTFDRKKIKHVVLNVG
ncbi:alpha-L-fucosidase [Chitinophaga skermanii]|uniref:Alpha-L-fucosidase n=1 Tax=Chitinophaga skermanii TaxID=331697 RepID=A0A327Q7Z2_9BACT|nr:sialidase family protein [Chitinophaga skermanii]RAI97906.1 alpha-L-fucosidase [Chitinophaga skermanii]